LIIDLDLAGRQRNVSKAIDGFAFYFGCIHWILTVVLIHMRQATLAPMAIAPAVPPLIADFPALFMISSKVGCFPLVASAELVEALILNIVPLKCDVTRTPKVLNAE
jgi:hypothetical protein